MPGMTRRLKTAEPTIVPAPMSFSDMNTPITLVKSSGAEVPIAINVAPAMSGGRCRAGQKEDNTQINCRTEGTNSPSLMNCNDSMK